MRSEKKKKSKRWLKITGIVILLLVIGAGAYAYSVYNSLQTAVETMHHPVDRYKSDKRTEGFILTK